MEKRSKTFESLNIICEIQRFNGMTLLIWGKFRADAHLVIFSFDLSFCIHFSFKDVLFLGVILKARYVRHSK